MKIKTSHVILYSIIIVLLYMLLTRQSSGYHPFLRPGMIAKLGTSSRRPYIRPNEPTSRPNVGRGTNNKYFKGGLLNL